jgi:hypothetical protein
MDASDPYSGGDYITDVRLQKVCGSVLDFTQPGMMSRHATRGLGPLFQLANLPVLGVFAP